MSGTGNGNGSFERFLFSGPENESFRLTGVGILANRLDLKFFWFPEYAASEACARLLIQSLYCVKERWELFLKSHIGKTKRADIAVICDGVERAMKAKFEISDWDPSKVPIWGSSVWWKENRLAIRLVLVEEFVDCDPSSLSRWAVDCVNYHLLTEIGLTKNAEGEVKKFSRSIKPILATMYDSLG